MTSAVSTSQRSYPNAEAVARILSAQYGDNAHANRANPLSELLFILCSLQTNEDLYKASYARL
jgi:hypothetical protein